jgi:hypothetical protein
LVWAEGAQHRLELEGEAPPKKKASRLAMACGFSLPADTAVHAFDRVGRCLAARPRSPRPRRVGSRLPGLFFLHFLPFAEA